MDSNLAPFVPVALAGITRVMENSARWACAAAYLIAEGTYATLDIQATFLRGPRKTTLVDLHNAFERKEVINGYEARVEIDAERTTIKWYLPERLFVTLSSPTENMTRAMASDLRIGDLAKLAAQR
jgi:hypothetical protein